MKELLTVFLASFGAGSAIYCGHCLTKILIHINTTKNDAFRCIIMEDQIKKHYGPELLEQIQNYVKEALKK